MTVRLQVSELRVGYGSVVILQGVGVVLNEGEIVCIAGPNGAGKSTLLKAVAGILPWRTGSVVIDGIAAESGQTRDLARQHLSYVPQVANIFPSLTVEENIAVVLRDRGRRRRQELDRAFTSFPGLRDLRTQMGGSLSGGQRQALASHGCCCWTSRVPRWHRRRPPRCSSVSVRCVTPGFPFCWWSRTSTSRCGSPTAPTFSTVAVTPSRGPPRRSVTTRTSGGSIWVGTSTPPTVVDAMPDHAARQNPRLTSGMRPVRLGCATMRPRLRGSRILGTGGWSIRG